MGSGAGYWGRGVSTGARLPTSPAPGKHDTFLTPTVCDITGKGEAAAVSQREGKAELSI